MELSVNHPGDIFSLLSILWLALGSFLILTLGIWDIAKYFYQINHLGYHSLAFYGLMLAIILWPVAVFVAMPFLAWVAKQEKKKRIEAEETLHTLMNKQS